MRLQSLLPQVPSAGRGTAPRRVRLLVVLAARDEMRFLPGWFANVAPHVDGVVALDDGSTDGTTELLESRPEVVELIRRPRGRAAWDEVGDYKALISAAVQAEADWIVSLDADHRVEREFRDRAERVIRRGGRLGLSAYAFHVRELWGGPDTYRADGVWGKKVRARLFRARADHEFDERALHAHKGPRQAQVLGRYPVADLEVYHLRMLEPADREARRRRYETLDPDAVYQPGLGYAYLTDETGLRAEAGAARARLDRGGSVEVSTPELCVVVLSYRNEAGGRPRPSIRCSVRASRWRSLCRTREAGRRRSCSPRGRGSRVVAAAERRLPGAARNAGVAATSAPFVAFLAADCVAGPGVGGRAGWLAIGTGTVAVRHPGGAVGRGRVRARALAQRARPPASTARPDGRGAARGFVRPRGCSERHGPFPENGLVGEDTLAERGECSRQGVEIAWAPEVVTRHRYPTSLGAALAGQLSARAQAQGQGNPSIGRPPAAAVGHARAARVARAGRPRCCHGGSSAPRSP